MTSSVLNVTKRDRVTTVTLSRPAVMNAIDQEMHNELQLAFDNFASDAEQFICVVTGAGDKAFCAGSDLKAGLSDVIYPKNGYAGLIERYDLFKPIIAAVNGVCLGGGLELALACDIIIAADNAIFGLPEPRVGAVALGGGIHRLIRQIGQKRAMGYLLSCARMSATEAYSLGLANEVVPPDSLEAAVDHWCGEILYGAPLAVRATKEVAMRGLAEVSLQAAISNQKNYLGFQEWLAADDTEEGPRAFADKRLPKWRGR